MTRLLTLAWRSPVLWGMALTVAFFAPFHSGLIDSPFVQRYFAGHWVEYVETAAFFIGLCALWGKWLDVSRQTAAVEELLLPPAQAGGHALSECGQLLAHLRHKTPETASDALPRRLRDALEAVQRRGNPDKLDEELKYLGDLDAVRSAQGYAFVKIIIWAIPILGFLGTVIGITEAIANLSPQQLEQSLPEVTRGLGVAFDTTAIALGFSMVLMFIQYSVDKNEGRLLERVDNRANSELSGRFSPQLALDDPLNLAVERLLGALLPVHDKLLNRQVDLWHSTVDEAHDHWKQVAATSGQQLETGLAGALEAALLKHADHVATTEREATDRQHSHLTGIQQALDRATDKLVKQQSELAKQSDLLIKAVDAANQIQQLEESLNHSLNALAGSQQLQETLVNLGATLQLLTTRIGALPLDSTSLELPRSTAKKPRGQAA